MFQWIYFIPFCTLLVGVWLQAIQYHSEERQAYCTQGQRNCFHTRNSSQEEAEARRRPVETDTNCEGTKDSSEAKGFNVGDSSSGIPLFHWHTFSNLCSRSHNPAYNIKGLHSLLSLSLCIRYHRYSVWAPCSHERCRSFMHSHRKVLESIYLWAPCSHEIVLFTLPISLNVCLSTLYGMQALQRSQSVQVVRVVSPFISMAERVRRFQLKTPERYHMLPSRTGFSQQLEAEKPKLKLTRPKTPELETMQRSRPPR